jgi:hypothetical protein
MSEVSRLMMILREAPKIRRPSKTTPPSPRALLTNNQIIRLTPRSADLPDMTSLRTRRPQRLMRRVMVVVIIVLRIIMMIVVRNFLRMVLRMEVMTVDIRAMRRDRSHRTRKPSNPSVR